MKVSVFWDITLRTLAKETTNVLVEHVSIFRAEEQTKQETSMKWAACRVRWFCILPASCWFLPWFTLQIWRWRWHVPPKHWLSTQHYIPEDRTLQFRKQFTKLETGGILRILTMVYNTQNYWVFRLCPLSGILKTRKHNVSDEVNSV
jgi:hypothetical protein